VIHIKQFGARLRDIRISQVITNNRAVLSLHKTIIIGMPGSLFSKTYKQFIQQPGYYMVYEFRAIIGMESVDNEGELE